jgi:hypothetical protein
MLGSDLHVSWEISFVPEPYGAGGTSKLHSPNVSAKAGEQLDMPAVSKKPPLLVASARMK